MASHLLTQTNSLNLYNRAISGNKVADVLDRGPQIMTELRADWLSLLIGINDIWHTLAVSQKPVPEDIADGIDQYLCLLRKYSPNIRIVLLEPFAQLSKEVSAEWFTFLKPLQRYEKELADKHQCIWVPTQEALNQSADKLGANHVLWDGVHPTPAGHMIIARQWLSHTTALQQLFN
ncbi:lysophospholipase L1 and related esterase [Gynuella sunshinyii YC6258]|uniref:Lysophospholipase L1 and related esterase n=1 Tax=Gynuella sunshinyii YC6258 TaxID=1445510 RepID=A0A0C5VPI2_9GAMM|nr:lysophospholipase L1 and related esterase [Gynuella sunshinyii YC6258]